jgi:hypothetical protein
MNTTVRVLAGIVLAAGLCALLRADDKDSKTISLYNGKDLSGWVGIFKDANVKTEDVFAVQDGVIHCKGHPAGYIRTEKDYTSYVLKVQWRFVKPGNSGVLVRVQAPDKVWPKSVECQLNSGDAGDIWDIDEFPIKTDPGRTGGRRTKKMKPSNEKPIGEWNEYEITLDGGNLTLKVNGDVQNQATDMQVVPGKILLQSEGAEIEFRNIELTPLGS